MDNKLNIIKSFNRIANIAIEEIGGSISDLFNVTYITYPNIRRYIKLIERLQDSNNFSNDDINNCISYIHSITSHDIFDLDVSRTRVYDSGLNVIGSFEIYDEESDDNYKVSIYIAYSEFAQFSGATVSGPYGTVQLSKEEYTSNLVRSYLDNVKEWMMDRFNLVDSSKIVEE